MPFAPQENGRYDRQRDPNRQRSRPIDQAFPRQLLNNLWRISSHVICFLTTKGTKDTKDLQEAFVQLCVLSVLCGSKCFWID
jgi:hypothetical protein